MFGLGTWEIVIVLGIALLLFGRRLPDVGKNLGRGIVEFKKGIKGIEDEVETATTRPSASSQVNARSASLPEGEPTKVVVQPPMDRTGQESRVSRIDPVE